MNGNTSLPLLLLYSGLSSCPQWVSIPDVQTTNPHVEWRGQPSVHKVQLSTEELRKHLEQMTISGRTFRAIEAAIPELERRNLRVEDYRIRVYRTDTSIFVLFGNPSDNSPGGIECPGPRPCIRVELVVDDLRVIGSEEAQLPRQR
jgi:hypothetical protein